MTQNLDQYKNINYQSPHTWIATWFGIGLIRKAPGTWGSLAAIPFSIILFKTLGVGALILGIVLVILVGYISAKKFDEETGGHDSKMIVIDEVAGQWITLLPVFYLWGSNPYMITLAFILFRFFDILKPWPVSHFDKNVKGAWGVMLDDVMAGLIAAFIIGIISIYV